MPLSEKDQAKLGKLTKRLCLAFAAVTIGGAAASCAYLSHQDAPGDGQTNTAASGKAAIPDPVSRLKN